MPEWRDGERATREWFACDAVTLAKRLLGSRLVRRGGDGSAASGMIVETEAYLGVKDRASHAFGGRRTPRTEPMYGPPGTAYVYFTYGMHHCFNVVCGKENEPAAVLVRALSPIDGLPEMRRCRSRGRRPGTKPMSDRNLTRGPACLCQALCIGREFSGVDLTTDERLWLEVGPSVPRQQIVSTPRIGVAYAKEWASRLLRFHLRDNPHVSGPRGESGYGMKG